MNAARTLKLEQMIGRLPKSMPPDYADWIKTAYGIVDTAATRIGEIKADKALSPIGVAEKVKGFLGDGPMQHINDLLHRIELRRAGIESELMGFMPKIDKTDTLAEMQRAEVRTWLRSLPPIERMKAVEDSSDAMIREAVAFAPAELTGLPALIRDEVIEGLMRASKPGAAERIDLLNVVKSGCDVAETAIRDAAADVRRDAGISEKEFAAAYGNAA